MCEVLCREGSQCVMGCSVLRAHCISSGIRVVGSEAALRRNLVTLTLWPGSYRGRQEAFNYDWNAAIEVGVLGNRHS